MNRLLLLGLILGAAPGAMPNSAQANTEIPVHIDDLGALSRVAIPFWPKDGWRISQTGRTVEITFPGAHPSFDLAAIAANRKSGRVSSAHMADAPKGAALTLTLSCNCAATAYAIDGAAVVVEITSSGAAPKPVPRRADDQAGKPIEIARRRLLAQLQRAAETGILTFKDAAAPTPQKAAADAPAAALARPAPETAPLPTAGARTPKDRTPETQAATRTKPQADVAAGTRAPAPESEPKHACLPDTVLDFTTWSHGMDAPGAGLAPLRAGLVGEFDAPDHAAALALAHRYLAMGWGAEARMTLTRLAEQNAETAALIEVAQIIEGRAPSPNGAIMGAVGCDGVHALLQAAAAATAGRPKAALRYEARAGAALPSLPRDLRVDLGARIGLAAIAAGNINTARRLYALLQRTADAPSPELELLAAHVHLAEGRTTKARDILRRLSEGKSPQAAAAAVALAASLSAADAPVPEKLRLDLGAAALILRGTDLGEAALEANAKALASVGDLHGALKLLETEKRRSPERAGELRNAARKVLETTAEVGGAPSPAAVETFLASADILTNDAPAARARLDFARSVMDLGLPNAAAAIARPAHAAAPGKTAALLAETALRQWNGPAALSALAQAPQGAARDAMTARALALTGAAKAAAAKAPDPVERAALAWRANDWAAARDDYAALGAQADPRKFALAAYMAGSNTPPETIDDPALRALFTAPDDPAAPLASAKALSESAAAVADLLKRMLDHG